MARDEPQMNLRIPSDLKDKIEEAATANKRSVTAEVVARLEDSFVHLRPSMKVFTIDENSAQQIADKVVHSLDERDRRRKTR